MSKQKDVFIIAQYYAKPRSPKMTRVPGYMSNEDNVVWDERVDVTYGLKPKDLLASKVVINISKQSVERDSFKSGKGFYELFEYFYATNPKEIANAIRRFGITIGKTDDNDLSENVQGKEEEGIHGTAEAQSDVAGEGNQNSSSNDGITAIPTPTTA